MKMIPNTTLTEMGVIPIRRGAVRFAVGAPDGVTSNSWKFWTTKSGAYLQCRDSFREVKLSLHPDGRWRFAFDKQWLNRLRPDMIAPGQDRTWEVWDEPPAAPAGVVAAFRLVFPTSELGVRPEQRKESDWAKVIFIEAGPPGRVTIVTVFITTGEPILRNESGPGFRLASLPMPDGRVAQLVAHGDADTNLEAFLAEGAANAHSMARTRGISVPRDAFAYLYGRRADGSRFVVAARMNRPGTDAR